MRIVVSLVAACVFGLAPSLIGQDQRIGATVLIRVLADVTVEVTDESGVARDRADRTNVLIASGTGMVVSPFGYVLTNHHVIAGGTTRGRLRGLPAEVTLNVRQVEVRTAVPGGGRGGGRYDASIVATDPELDLALLQIPAIDMPYIPFGDSDAVEPGAAASVSGYPLGEALDIGRRVESGDSLAPALSAGTVSALRPDDFGNVRYIQTSAPVNRGNSGGPLLDRHGFAIGVVEIKAAAAEGIGFAIPINLVKEFFARNGLDSFLPSSRLRHGHPFEDPRKLVSVQVLEGFEDGAPSRLTVDSGGSLPGVTFRMDRVATSWSVEQLEQELLAGREFDRIALTPLALSIRDEDVLHGQAVGRSASGRVRVVYALVDLGAEKLVARYVGGVEPVAFNESVLAQSLRTLRGAPMLNAQTLPVTSNWSRIAAPPWAPSVRVIPSGWLVDAGAPRPCAGMAPPRNAFVVSAPGDFTTALGVAGHAGSADPAAAAARCAGSRGAAAGTSYRSSFSSFGTQYAVEGVFEALPGGLLQLELVTPAARAPAMRVLFSRWLSQLRPAPSHPES